MADIKIREMKKGTIKTLDKAAVASERIKNVSAKTKDMAQANDNTDNSSPTAYASDNISRGAENASGKVINRAEVVGKRSMAETRKNIIKARNKSKELRTAGRETQDIAKTTVKSGGKTIKNAAISAEKSRRTAAVTAKQTKIATEQARKTVAQSAKVTKKAGEIAAKSAKKVAQATIKAVKLAIAGIKALASALIAMGWLAVIVIIICCLFGAAFYFFGDNSSSEYTPVSKEVEAYEPLIREYANKYGIGEYVNFIKAVMMQESGGRGNDPMQSSEGPFNKKYPKSPNGITDPKYSVECGVQELKSVLQQAKVANPLDMDRIKLALQGYNYGNGYIPWAVKTSGGYSAANAAEFSNIMAKKMGWSSYGDKEYVPHVLRYYPYGNFSYDVEYNGSGKLGLPIKGMTKGNITSHFGPRSSPGGIGSTNHQGLDIAFPQGTHILACESGTVELAGWNGGLGKCIIISHGKGLQTVYGHQSKLNVKAGQKVVRGQYIGEVGSTGNSTGAHLHLGIKVNGQYVNPEKGWLSIP